MWFVAMLVYLNGVEQHRLEVAMASPTYLTEDRCMTDAIRRTDALASVGMHGRYMCMRHNEPARQLAAAEKRDF